MRRSQDMVQLGPLTVAQLALATVDATGDLPEDAALGLPSEILNSGLDSIVENAAILLSDYDTILLAHPELAMLEALAHASYEGTVLTLVPTVLADAVVSELQANVPGRLDCVFARPDASTITSVRPVRAALVCVGVDAGPELHLLPSWARESLGNAASCWFGEVLLLLACEARVSSRPLGWSMLDDERRFTGRLAMVGKEQ